MLGIDQHRGWRIGFEQRSLRQLTEAEPPRCRLLGRVVCENTTCNLGSTRKFDLARPAATDVPIDAMLLADRLEAIRNIAHGFGGPEKENSVAV